MKIQLKKGTLDMCVLALLARKDSYSYEIASNLAQGMDVSEGTIYPLMRRLQNESWVSTYLVESSSGPARKYYRLTPEGQRELASMRQEWREFVTEVESVLNAQTTGSATGLDEEVQK
ncbi:PadR family transcriptional regulator [Amantichitinum ursilacus]|uniref:Transcriptional regulator YqjI n=1 Tax=Amantichitinum ursilacus TaxID=857265 RepID=A0A0N0GLY6_9NEIS|nr:PadR family transcriptional regulator [Amantichitinum ursilacus]KPC50508.1 Transcriptional regulator YqjI [Amantichitinum ursilacus]